MRCFISINIPREVAQDIRKIQEGLPEFQGKKTELGNLHLTLKFLGEIDAQKVEEVKKKLKEIKFEKFESEINLIGAFSEEFIRIIWLYLSNCHALQKIIDEKLKDLFELERRFMSHLTIARVKNVENKRKFLEDSKKIKIPEIKFQVGKFYLMKSELTSNGPRYEVLEEYKLA